MKLGDGRERQYRNSIHGMFFFSPLSRVFRDKNVSVHEYALLVLALRSAYLIWSVMTLGVL